MTPSVYTFKYYLAPRELRDSERPFETELHKIRDGLASEQLLFSLFKAGYSYGGSIINVPERVLLAPLPPKCDSQPPINGNDVILLTTRPPIHGRVKNNGAEYERNRRPLERSGELVENRVFKSLESVLAWCTRDVIDLADREPYLSIQPVWRSIQFTMNHGGGLIGKGDPQGDRLTVGYLISIPPTEDFPRIVAAFGPGGTETMVFCWLLRTELQQYFSRAVAGNQQYLVMATFRAPIKVPHPYLDFDLCDLNPHVVVEVAAPA